MAIVAPAYLDEAINEHLASLSNLRTQKNSYLPICRLPPETLANIFTHSARDYHENDGDLTPRIPHWINISYVCHYWRNVALSCPTLWTYHFTVSLRWTEELLARSKHASLKICIHFDSTRTNSWWSILVEKLLSHAERIKVLRLRVPPTVLPSRLSLCAPRLQILDIDGDESDPSEWTSTINDGDIPPLRTLKLSNCPLRWHSLNLSGLTTLSLRHVPPPFQQNIVEFLAMLSRMQALTVLHLEHALVTARDLLSSGTFKVSSKINLPYLTRLFIAAPLSTVVAILSCVIVPSKTQVRLEIGEDRCSDDDYARLSLVLAQRFSQSEDLSFHPTIRSLAINFTSRLESFFVLCASEHSECDFVPSMDQEYPPLDNCNMSLVILIEVFVYADVIISNICCAIPLTHSIQTLHVFNPPFSSDFWRKMLNHLHALRHIKLSNGSMPDLACWLALIADEPEETPKGHVTCDPDPTPGHKFVPMLEALTLDHIVFTSKCIPSYRTLSYKPLLEALSTRKALQPRLTEIECSYDIDLVDIYDYPLFD